MFVWRKEKTATKSSNVGLLNPAGFWQQEKKLELFWNED